MLAFSLQQILKLLLLLPAGEVVKLLVLRVGILILKVRICNEVIWQHDLTFLVRK